MPAASTMQDTSANAYPKLRSHLFDDSGGLGYHLRALRHRRTLWAPFIAQVADWLNAWQAPTAHLVIIGPSGGYTLDQTFLQRFARITVLEPDPLARLILRRRFSGLRIEHAELDCLSEREGPIWLSRLYPGASLLFANVLGQSPALTEDARWTENLRTALQAHHWASWHDVLSAATPPLADTDRPLEPAADITTLATRCWRWPTQVCDHDSFGLAGRQDGLALWQLGSAQWQIVEWGVHGP
tara:strand:- start:20908 stop:21633 length:726 start_codon:yes stop_codon:yes gene_type:complete